MQFAAVKGIVNLNEMASFVYDINEHSFRKING